MSAYHDMVQVLYRLNGKNYGHKRIGFFPMVQYTEYGLVLYVFLISNSFVIFFPSLAKGSQGEPLRILIMWKFITPSRQCAKIVNLCTVFSLLFHVFMHAFTHSSTHSFQNNKKYRTDECRCVVCMWRTSTKPILTLSCSWFGTVSFIPVYLCLCMNEAFWLSKWKW